MFDFQNLPISEADGYKKDQDENIDGTFLGNAKESYQEPTPKAMDERLIPGNWKVREQHGEYAHHNCRDRQDHAVSD